MVRRGCLGVPVDAAGAVRDLAHRKGSTTVRRTRQQRRNDRRLVQSPLGPFTEQTFHAFAYDTTGRNAGVMRALGTLGGSYAIAFAINERGDIVGESETASGAVHVFVWRDGVMIDLGALP
jgi:probable HAF family extracellular repeat protein